MVSIVIFIFTSCLKWEEISQVRPAVPSDGGDALTVLGKTLYVKNDHRAEFVIVNGWMLIGPVYLCSDPLYINHVQFLYTVYEWHFSQKNKTNNELLKSNSSALQTFFVDSKCNLRLFFTILFSKLKKKCQYKTLRFKTFFEPNLSATKNYKKNVCEEKHQNRRRLVKNCSWCCQYALHLE